MPMNKRRYFSALTALLRCSDHREPNAMTILHTFSTSAQQHAELAARLLRSVSRGDTLLLLGDGTYNLADKTFLQAVQEKELQLYAMTIDVQARGLQTVSNNANAADDALFVELSCQHSKVVSWFP